MTARAPNINRSKIYEEYVQKLAAIPLPGSERRLFPTIRELLCFAALLGFSEKRRLPLDRSQGVEDVSYQQFERGDAENLIYLIALAGYARQRSRLMRALFGLVQRLDGFENTEPNARGAMEAILADLEPDSGCPRRVFRTPTGEISLFRLKVGPALQKRLAPPVTGGSREAS